MLDLSTLPPRWRWSSATFTRTLSVPSRSMLKYLLDMNQRRDIVLLYANRTADEIAYKDILGEGQTKLGIKAFYTLTNTKAIPRNWRGLVGRIDEHMIQAVVPDYEERTFYLSGSLDMVRAYEHILKNMHVKNERIKKDFFPGLGRVCLRE